VGVASRNINGKTEISAEVWEQIYGYKKHIYGIFFLFLPSITWFCNILMAKINLSDVVVPDYIADMWNPLNSEQQEFLKNSYSLRECKKNEVIYCESEIPRHLMCLLKGKVKIFKDGVGGRSQIIRMIKPVQYFGYRAYFANENYVTAAATMEASLLCLIPMDIVKTLVNQNNDLALFFIKQLSIDLGIADERTVNLTQKHIRGRLAESLLVLKEGYGLEEDASTLSIYLSREDLANLSNMTTSNAIRTLSNFANEKLITIDGRKIKIIDEEQLKKISRIG
jgi:CRP-like cAMP-binding protein